MEIAQYYKNLLADITFKVEKLIPASLVGMGGCGRSYIFSLLKNQLTLVTTNTVIFLDLSGVDGDTTATLKLLNHEFMSKKLIGEPKSTISELLSQDRVDLLDKPLILILNAGYNENLNLEFLQCVSRVYRPMPKKLSYVMFLNVSNLYKSAFISTAIKNLVSSCQQVVLPLNVEDAKLVLATYETKFQKTLSESVKNIIITYSGGHPGLMKALFLQAKNIESWEKPDYLEPLLNQRLRYILGELDQPKIQLLIDGTFEKNNIDTQFLKYYGYVNNNFEVFTPAMSEFLALGLYKRAISTLDTNILRVFTKSQREVYDYLKTKKDKIITRDEIASVIWNDAGSLEYSDWALDQFMHTFREKLGILKDSGNIITKKGEGYIFKL